MTHVNIRQKNRSVTMSLDFDEVVNLKDILDDSPKQQSYKKQKLIYDISNKFGKAIEKIGGRQII